MYYEIDFSIRNYITRQGLRRQVVSKFLDEEPGIGKGSDTAHYRYNVETLSDGRIIYLIRPAYLKKGFDFRISVEGMIFQTKKDYPKHADIFDDLRAKKNENPAMSRRFYEAIKEVYECKDPEDILPKHADIKFDTGYSLELVLKVIKWFFIEQDIRDWNYSGRRMFMKGVEEILR